MKHTPGPWGISEESPNIIVALDFMGATGVLIGSSSGHHNSGFFPSDEAAAANARLMAASPELFSALHALEVAANTAVYCYEKLPANFAFALADMQEAALNARAIAAKATGEPS